MLFDSLYLKNFRLYKEKSLNISTVNTVITGSNGSGKTTLLESINILLTGKSFRTNYLQECVKEGEREFFLKLDESHTENKLTLTAMKSLESRSPLERSNRAKITNKADLPVPVVILSKHLRMIESEPELRRDYFNKIMFHVEQDAHKVHTKYKKILTQRNKALKRKLPLPELSFWTEKLIESGLELHRVQESFFLKLRRASQEKLKRRENKKNLKFLDGIEISFDRGWSKTRGYELELSESIEKDRILGFTLRGPHRFDLIFTKERRLASTILSRGQHKFLVISMYLVNNALLKEKNNSGAIFLIDDITSELDEANLETVLEDFTRIEEQVILTAVEGKVSNQNQEILSQFKQINI
mgnify:CR=1 FL=1